MPIKKIALITEIKGLNIDPLIKVKNAYSAHKLIQSSQLEIVNDMGHLLDEESYAKFQNRFIEFLHK